MKDSEYFGREYFTLHPGKARYLDYLAGLLPRDGGAPGALLDVGSARGLLLRRLREAGWTAIGLEGSLHACVDARAAGLAVLQGNAEKPWPLADRSFDAVLLHDVIEHLRQPGQSLSECRRVLRSDGMLVVVTTNRHSLARPLLGSGWSFYRDPTHVHAWSAGELRAALSAAGFASRVWTAFNFFTAGESAPRLKPLRRLRRVVRVPLIGESLYAVARPRPAAPVAVDRTTSSNSRATTSQS